MNISIRALARVVALFVIVAVSPSVFGATVTWDAGGGDENWSNALNWSGDALPTTGDDVIITSAGTGTVRIDVNPIVNSITVQNGAALSVESGQVLTVNNPSSVDSDGLLSLSGGTFSGNGDLTVNGTVYLDGSTLGGNGALTINPSGVLYVFVDTNVSEISRTTTNAGFVFYEDFAPGPNFIFSGATLTNTGTIDIETDNDIDAGGTPTLNNDSGGVIRKSAGTGSTRINFTVNHAAGATIQAQTGAISLNAGGSAAGACDISSGATLRLSGGTFTLANTATVTGAGTFTVVGATLDAGPGVDITFPHLEIQSGTITGAGAVRMSATFNWLGGRIAGSGLRVLNNTSAATIGCSAAACLLDGAALQLQASATYSAFFPALALSNGASLTIDPGKTLSITQGGFITNGGGAASSIINNGTIWKKTTGSTCLISVPVTLSGTSTVDIDTGALQFGAGVNVDAGATLDIASGKTLEVTGGVFLFNSGTITMPGSGTFKVSAGTLSVPTGVNLTMPSVTLQGSGVINGAGDVHVSGNFAWLGGTITGGGARVLDSTSTPTISCSLTCLLDGATLQLQAPTTTYSATTSFTLVFSNGASLTIDPGKTLNLTDVGGFQSGGGAPSSIVNNGTIWKTSAGISTLGVPVTLSGTSTVQIDAGTLQFGGDTTVGGNAILDIASGKTLEVTGGVFLFNSGTGSMPGSGIFTVSGGTLRVPTGITKTIPNMTLQGSGVIDGGGTLILSGVPTWGGGTMGSAAAPGGVTQIDSGITLNTAAGAKSLTQSRQLLNNGTFNYNVAGANILTMSGNSKITNHGMLNLAANAITAINVSGSALIENDGTINRNAVTGVCTLNPTVDNHSSGTVSVSAGTLGLNGGGTERGNFTVSSGANLILSGSGIFSMLGFSTVGGAGTFSILGATVDVGNGPGGSSDVWIIAAPTTCSGTINLKDASLVLSSAFSVTGTIEHYGGAISGSGTMTISNFGVMNCRGTDSPSTIAINTTINSGGKLNSPANALQCGLSNNITVTNNGLIDFQSDGGLSSFSGAPQLVNNHLLRKSAGSGTTGINVSVSSNSSSLVEADSGTLTFNQGSNFAGVTFFGGGIVALPATAAVSGTTTLLGKLQVTGNAAVSGTLDLWNTLLLDNGVDVTWPNVSLSSASSKIDGAGTLRVSGNFTWSGGTITGVGARVLESTSVPAISCSAGNCLLDGATLQLQAWGTYSASSNALLFSNGASLILDPGKVLFVTNDGDFLSAGGAPSSIVVGGFASGTNACIQKTTTSGTTIIGVPVTLSGSLMTVAGTMQAGAGVTVAAPGAIIHYDLGTTIEVTGGVFLFNTGSVSFPANGDFKVSAGTLRVPTGVTLTTHNVTLQGSGVIDGGGTLNLSGTTTWASGTMGSATAAGGITQISSGSTLNITSAGSQTLTQGRELRNSGTINYGGTSTLTMSGASKITNNTAFNLTADRNINLSGSATIDNNGTLTKNGGSGTSTLFPVVNNAGTVSAVTGTISFAGGGTNSGSINVTSPGSLSFSSGTLAVSGGSISGNGTLTFNGATATIGVPINVGALNVTGGSATLNANGSADAFTMSGGTLGGSGTLTLNNGGTWSAGTMSGSGTTTNPSSMTFSIPGAVTITGRTLQNNGTLNVSGAVIGGTGTIANTGTINDTVDATISAPMNNSGQVTASAHLSLAGNGSHSGTFTASSPASVIDFSGGAQTISGPFAGAGKFRFSGGTEAVNGAWSGMTFDVAGGSVALNTSGTLPALNLSGGTLAGSGALTVTGASTWSGGTISGSGPLTFDAGATVTMPGTNAATLSRPLVNQGTINFAAASSAMLIDGVPVTNSGTFDIQSSQNILVTAGTPPFVNNGTLKKSSGAGAVQFAAPLSNSGLVQVGAGTLNFSGVYAQTAGTTEVQAGATLQTGTLSLNGGSLVGNGTIAGTVANHAVVAPGASPGTLTINGDYVQASNGVLNIQVGGTTPGTEYDRLLVSGNVTLDGSLNVLPINSFVPAAGNAFQVLTFGGRPAYTAFAFINGLAYGSGTTLVPAYNANDLQLITNSLQADLAVSVSAPPSVASGSAFAYTVSIINQGGSDATAVTFSAALPPNVTYNGASPAICSGAPNLVCTIGALANQSAAMVVLNVTANGPGAAPIIVSTTGNEFDPDASNNSTLASPSITSTADLRIAVTGTPSTVAGSRAVYTIAVTNNGPDIANNVAVSVTASAGLSLSANGGACTGSFPCTLGALSSGQSATITSAWDISPAAAGSVQLTANATSSTPDPNSSNNSASVTTLIGTCPAIVIDAPHEITTGASAQASASATAALAGGATYNWSISDGTIDSGNGTDTITFTTGVAGNATLAVDVTGTACTISTSILLTVKARQTCQGTAVPTAPAEGTTTADAVINFAWTEIEGASGYRLWLQQGDARPRSLGRTLGTSLTKVIPPGVQHWYVETLFDGCASHQSDHLALTILPAQDCDTHGASQLTAPAIDTTSTTATVAFSWGAVAKAIQYELWLAPAGGVPTLIRTTSDTSSTADVPPGRLEWYVRAIFGGCGATESAHQTFTYTPPPQCTSQRPLLIAPAEGERLTSPVSFEWRSVPGATSYEVYVDGVLAATTSSPHTAGIPLPLNERRWRVRARLAEGCGALDSAESRMVDLAPAPSCTPLEAPLVTAPAQISSGVAARIQWTFVPGASAYVVQISNDPQFSRAATSSSTVATRELPFTFTNDSSVPAARYVRVYAIDTECVVPGSGPFSPVAVVSVLPRNATMGVALLSDPADIEYTLNVPADLAGLSFTATPTASWITVTPSSGIVPPGGQTLRAFAHTAGLPPGASTGNVVITTADAAGTRAALGGRPPTSSPITANNLSGVNQTAGSTPPDDALTIPAVANVKNFIVRFESDVRITNTSAQVITYDITFTPSGSTGNSQGQKITQSIEPGATLALDDIVTTWLAGVTTSGALEIHSETETGSPDRITFASSRTFGVSPDGGTFGQYVPAVNYENFVSQGSVISLQQIAQSDKFHTNLGLVEGSGNAVTVEVSIFDSAGTQLEAFNVELSGGEHTQINEVLKQHGIALDDGRIEVKVKEGDGKVTAYASVIGTGISDPLLVPPVNIGDDGAGHQKWVVPGVGGPPGESSNWKTDVHIFNAGKDSAVLTLVFYPTNRGTATTKTITLAAREVRRFADILATFFGISQGAGALHVSSDVAARLVVTARTYDHTTQGDFGQFIPASTPEEAVAKGKRPLQILQIEQSDLYRSNIGFAEVSGKAVTLEVSVFRPGQKTPALLELTLAPNEFRQMDSLPSTMGLGDTFNARISVSVKDGEGSAIAYLSLVDRKSGDPTYFPGQ
jgi:fibronectin-binding autotransporter adhesin